MENTVVIRWYLNVCGCGTAIPQGQLLKDKLLCSVSLSVFRLSATYTLCYPQQQFNIVKLLYWFSVCVCVYLCVNKSIVEQYEPVVGESPGILQSQSSAAAFTNHTALRETQNLLKNTRAHLLMKICCIVAIHVVWGIMGAENIWLKRSTQKAGMPVLLQKRQPSAS